jgi:hypothetical protein
MRGSSHATHHRYMDTSDRDLRTPPSWRRPLSAGFTTLGLVVLAVVVVGVATAIEQYAHPPTCFGIGFGCTPDALSTVVLIGWFLGAPIVVVAWLFSAIGWLMTRRRSDRINRWATWWPAWLLAGGLAVLVVIAAVTAG